MIYPLAKTLSPSLPRAPAFRSRQQNRRIVRGCSQPSVPRILISRVTLFPPIYSRRSSRLSLQHDVLSRKSRLPKACTIPGMYVLRESHLCSLRESHVLSSTHNLMPASPTPRGACDFVLDSGNWHRPRLAATCVLGYHIVSWRRQTRGCRPFASASYVGFAAALSTVVLKECGTASR